MFLNFFRRREGILKGRLWFILNIVVILAVFGAGFFAGRFIFIPKAEVKVEVLAPETPLGKVMGKEEAVPEYLAKDVDFNQFWRIWNTLKMRFYKQPVSEVKMFYGSLAGSVAALGDPYSVFLEPQTAEKFSQELSGVFGGIGAEIAIKQDKLIIIAPLADTPAERAGLKAGDKIYAIDKIDTRGLTLDEAVLKIRGQKGAEVTLTIMRNGFDKPKDFAITRDIIVIKSVQPRMLDNNIAYIRLMAFQEDTVPAFDKAVRELILQNPKGIIFDMRNNPGGFLQGAIDVAGEWIKDDVILIEKFGNGAKREYRSDGNGRLSDFKTVVLVNKGSASGAEIVAGALQDYKLATLVGETTFGKGSVQDYEQFSDGSALKLTIAEWLTPKSRVINEKGVEPDVKVEFTDEDFAQGRDPQMDKAVELLK